VRGKGKKSRRTVVVTLGSERITEGNEGNLLWGEKFTLGIRGIYSGIEVQIYQEEFKIACGKLFIFLLVFYKEK
jgi:hypothetical protein